MPFECKFLFFSCQSTAVYGLSDAIYCLSPDPVNSTILATASDDGKALILDTRLPVDNGELLVDNGVNSGQSSTSR